MQKENDNFDNFITNHHARVFFEFTKVRKFHGAFRVGNTKPGLRIFYLDTKEGVSRKRMNPALPKKFFLALSMSKIGFIPTLT